MDPLELWTQLNERFGNLAALRADQREAVNSIIQEQTGLAGGIDELATTARVMRQHPDASISQQDRLIDQSTESTALQVGESPRGGVGQDIAQGALTGLHGASLGSLDEIVGAISAVPALVPGGQSPGEAFTQGREQFKAEVDDFSNRNPKTALGLEIGGGLASGVGAPVALGALKGGTKLATFLKGIGVGAGEGAFAGAASAEPGKRGQGAAVGTAIGTAFGTAGPAISSTARAAGRGTVGLKNIFMRILRGTKKDPPSAQSVETAIDGTQAIVNEFRSPDTDFNPEVLMGNRLVNGSIERARALDSKFTLADHPAFFRLVDDADNVIARTSVAESRAGTAGSNLSKEASDLSGTAAFSPKLAGLKLLGRRLFAGSAQEELLQNRATSKWLSDRLHSSKPEDIDEVMRLINELLQAPSFVPGRPSIGAGFTGPAVQQLVESLDR